MKTPRSGWPVRPLTDRVRSALFNILGERVVGVSFLDLFAGTGAVGIEALSRGAAVAFFVELDRRMVALIRENLELTGLADRAEVYALDVLRALTMLRRKGAAFDLIFAGAPYDSPLLEKVVSQVEAGKLLRPEGLLIIEHRRQHQLLPRIGNLQSFRSARYGETILEFYKVAT